jgi:hypothetical protein
MLRVVRSRRFFVGLCAFPVASVRFVLLDYVAVPIGVRLVTYPLPLGRPVFDVEPLGKRSILSGVGSGIEPGGIGTLVSRNCFH